MFESRAMLVVFHGSHDAQYQQAVQKFLVQLRQVCRSMLFASSDAASRPQAADILIEATFLDCVPEPLHQQIQTLGRQMLAKRLVNLGDAESQCLLPVLPLFLLPGVHVMEDIPAEIVLAEAALPATMQIQALPYLGSLPCLATTLADCFSADQRIGRIVISHGSRRSGGNQPVEALAMQLNALSAFWSVEPSLATQVANLYDRGIQQIEVLPYFLFEGSMSAGIALQLSDMIQKLPDLRIKLLQTLTQQPGFIELVAQALMRNF